MPKLSFDSKDMKGVGAFIALLFMSLLLMLSVGIYLARVSYQNTKLTLTAEAQATNAARAGVVDALSWFRRQPTQPVHCSDPNFYPDYAFYPSSATGDTLDSTIGLVKEFQISNDQPLWMRYEVKRAVSANSIDPEAARDVTDKRIEGGVRGSGLVWSIVSTGYIFRKMDPNLPYNIAPNEIKARAKIATQFRRLSLNVPAGLVMRSLQMAGGGASALTINNAARVASRKSGIPAINYYSGSSASPIYQGTANSGNIIGGVAALSASAPKYLDPLTVFGVGKDEYRLMADITSSNFPTDFPANFPEMSLVFIDGNATFTATNPLRGSGILYVTGNLTLQANSNALFNGLIFVEGNFSMYAPALVSGAVMVGGASVLIDGTGDTSEIDYDENVLADVRQQIAQYREDRSSYFPQNNNDVQDVAALLISGVSVSGITTNSALVTWSTDRPGESWVEYGLDTNYGNSSGDTTLAVGHSVSLSGLVPNTVYHFRVKSVDSANNPVYSGDNSFTTTAPPPPVISGVNITGFTVGSIPGTIKAANVEWLTDTLSNSAVEYGLTAGYGTTGSNGTLVTAHSLGVDALSPNTLYHYRVKSTDAYGSQSVSSDYTFTTPPGAFTSNSSMNYARAVHSATLLTNGKVLVAGGSDSSNNALASAELYDPVTGTWATTGSMNHSRYNHQAFLLTNGKVLVFAGNSGAGGYATAEIYDPVAGTWSTTGSMSIDRDSEAASLLSDGRVLVAGGYSSTLIASLSTAEIYDPGTGTWSTTGSLHSVRTASFGLLPAALLTNGKVIIGDGGFTYSTAEIYDPGSGTWSTSNMNSYMNNNTVTRLTDGKVLFVGCQTQLSFVRTTTEELYDPGTGTWSTMPDPLKPLPWLIREFHSATQLSNGKVLVAGGDDSMIYLSTTELYDPVAGTWSTTGNLSGPRMMHTATVLTNGKVLIAGGTPDNTIALSTVELYVP